MVHSTAVPTVVQKDTSMADRSVLLREDSWAVRTDGMAHSTAVPTADHSVVLREESWAARTDGMADSTAVPTAVQKDTSMADRLVVLREDSSVYWLLRIVALVGGKGLLLLEFLRISLVLYRWKMYLLQMELMIYKEGCF